MIEMKDKSALVIDTPNNCYECKFNDCIWCDITGKNIKKYKDRYTECRPSFCPLISLPPQINLRQYTDNAAQDIGNMLAYQYAQGWNDCLDEIVNKEEE